MVAVLILEDDVDCRELLAEVFGQEAHDCVTAATLADLERRRDEALACDLAMLDINLGAGQPSGVDACHWLVDQGFHGRIVFLTGHGDSHPLVREAAKIVNASILTKPVRPRALVELTQEHHG